MPLPKPTNREAIGPRNTALHRRTRRRNVAILVALVSLMAVFYMVTIVRIQSGLDAG
ncbi:MAG: hypothetical protein ACKVH0_21380 [Alphaproteobacteria bacterium]|jgi:hypothetical protein